VIDSSYCILQVRGRVELQKLGEVWCRVVGFVEGDEESCKVTKKAAGQRTGVASQVCARKHAHKQAMGFDSTDFAVIKMTE